MKNSFKQKVAQAPQFGLWLALADHYSAEISAGAGFDFLLLDGEHSPIDLRTILGQLQAIAAYDVAPVVRPPTDDPVLIKQLLDIGANNLLIPMVETAEQARTIVASTRYPPLGFRGVGSGIARAARWGNDPEYMQTANDNICLILQIESVAGLANLEAIAATDGVDGIFFGAVDLSASMGLLGQPNHPDVIEAIDTAMGKVQACGKFAGFLSADDAISRHFLANGANFAAVGVDALLLSNAARALAHGFKQPDTVIETRGY
ncbi:2,4-dihydroxyhept-2-ene-1,7-dioic acid aldolase [Caenibius tardaugens NBRC 16725]|uniref:2,4-dihydroxyhept-2-ene-1,7-dioic acid aldolase n=1 Tax=Caenibius tardaugens NBRC 16725 TaxID=1219035 RepID=U3A5Q9_9SPHN|nr:HpcH/HpaI aldolase/citrate lyase family protein [Caenibius tardaugens]AZI35627.1 2-keto-3-deoxy-L-rhamnonate aldolase [Caenibius tardaugens NBRC 16725]GAD50088.1 2,4-dihydroxyhept-2-ene-1,7-dioic acid aldolase [Caenibius tardaugens NBRC 16725]